MQSGYGARYLPSHLLKEAKGVWLEVGDIWDISIGCDFHTILRQF